ncbi:MAG: pirin family protein [Candidatus Eremiobacteraeota bacterium]|nr:pirin family protein [Candidatus Eremiobacteraeota bacterium]
MAAAAPLFNVQRAAERYCADHGWLKTCHSFSFADYFDPNNLSWGALRVLNDDRVAPTQGFGMHAHRDMEIITYVLEGELEHKDSMGNHGVVSAGGVQYMSAGTGVRHSEFNRSASQELHFIQMWVVPSTLGDKPRYGQRDFSAHDRRGRWLLVASGRGAHGDAPISLRQDASFSVARLDGGSLSYTFDPGRLAFVFVGQGAVTANGSHLRAGDGVRIAGLPELALAGDADVLLWDIPALEHGESA